MNEGWVLIDGLERNRANPLRFRIPNEAEKEQIAIGCNVKIGVAQPNGHGERFWVKVTGRTGDTIHGVVDNDLVFKDEHGLDDTSPVSFEARHVLDILS